MTALTFSKAMRSRTMRVREAMSCIVCTLTLVPNLSSSCGRSSPSWMTWPASDDLLQYVSSSRADPQHDGHESGAWLAILIEERHWCAHKPDGAARTVRP